MERLRAWTRAGGLGAGLVFLLAPSGLAAQMPVGLDEAIRTALERGPRAAVARADSAAAAARIRTARQLPDPSLSLDYTKDPPHHHVQLEQPLEYPWVRSARVGGARAEAEAVALRTELERARIRYDVTAAYAEASAARGIMVVSHQTVADGEELVRIASVRRDAGDASDLDVDLASVTAAQLRSTLLTDSLALVSATLRLQAEMGLPIDSVLVVTTDTVAIPLVAPPVPAALEVSATLAEQRAASLRLREQRGLLLPTPAVRVGFERGMPEDEPQGLLPTAGVSLTIPLLSLNRGPIAEARAAVARAGAALALARTRADLARVQGERTRTLAQGRLNEDRRAVAAAQQVARRSLTAYREGAYALSSVIEAQRTARDAVRTYLDDLRQLWTVQAAAELAVIGGVQP